MLGLRDPGPADQDQQEDRQAQGPFGFSHGYQVVTHGYTYSDPANELGVGRGMASDISLRSSNQSPSPPAAIDANIPVIVMKPPFAQCSRRFSPRRFTRTSA